MNLRVGFDASALEAPHSAGVRRVARMLLASLEARGQLDVVRLNPPAGAKLSRWRQLSLPASVKTKGLLGIHSFTSAIALRGPGRRVQTIHELPWRHGVAENGDLRHRFWAAIGPWRADGVICPSEHVARDLRHRRLPGANRISVIPWGVDPIFAPEPPTGSLDEPLLERYRLGSDPIVFCPGAVRAKKNLAAVLRGVAQLKEQAGARVEVLISGPNSAELRRDLGLAGQLNITDRVTTIEEIDEADLPGIYRLSSAVCVLSPSEGFALPVLEALASGTPVVVPIASAQAEVAGPEAHLVEPSEPACVAAGILSALDAKKRLSFSLPKRAEDFRWEHAAAKVEALWNEIQ